MKLTKFVLPITALIMLFAPMSVKAETCVYTDGTGYDIPGAIQYRGYDLKFIKFCCDELDECAPGYAARDHYLLTHIAAMYKRDAVLKYLSEEKGIPNDMFPGCINPGDKVENRTPLMMTAVRGDYDGSKYLVDNNASVIKKDPAGKNAYDYAKQSGNQEVISYVGSAWNRAMQTSMNNVQKNKQKLIKLLTINDIKDEIKNFQRSIKFNGFFS